MASKVTVSFMVGLTLFMSQKGHSVIRGRHDLLSEPEGDGNLFRRFDIVYDPKKLTGSLEGFVTYFMTPKLFMN